MYNYNMHVLLYNETVNKRSIEVSQCHNIYPVSENLLIHLVNVFKTFRCHVSKMEEMSKKCFSIRFIKAVGNFSYTVSFSAIRINLDEEKYLIVIVVLSLYI